MSDSSNIPEYDPTSTENSNSKRVLVISNTDSLAGYFLQSKIYNLALTLEFEEPEGPDLTSKPIKQKKEGYVPSKRDVFNRKDRKRWIKQMRGK